MKQKPKSKTIQKAKTLALPNDGNKETEPKNEEINKRKLSPSKTIKETPEEEQQRKSDVSRPSMRTSDKNLIPVKKKHKSPETKNSSNMLNKNPLTKTNVLEKMNSKRKNEVKEAKEQPKEENNEKKQEAEIKEKPEEENKETTEQNNQQQNDISEQKLEMLNQLTDKNSSNNIKVFVRFRPLNEMEKDLAERNMGNLCVQYMYTGKDEEEEETFAAQGTHVFKSKECKCVKTVSPQGVESRPYYFDHVFDSETKQSEIYNYFGKDIMKDVLNGYNGTVFAYGQSGSGKTFTMYGPDIYDEENQGFIPRLISDVFDYCSTADSSIKFEIKMSFFQIYKEVICDLFTGMANLKIKENPVQGIYVDNLSEVCISSIDEFMEYVELGEQNRFVSATGLNAVSSRSHSILIFEITQTLTKDNFTKTGKLNLVDLAGSEKISKTGAVGETLEEAKKINLSLSALGNVIHALTSGAEHIPYRDSKLTRILQESLGGNFKTSLIVTCSPHSFHLDETTSSLLFATRAKKIKNKAKMNIKLTYQELQKIIKQLKIKLKLSQQEIERLKALIPADVLLIEEEKIKEEREKAEKEKAERESESNPEESNRETNKNKNEIIKKKEEKNKQENNPTDPNVPTLNKNNDSTLNENNNSSLENININTGDINNMNIEENVLIEALKKKIEKLNSELIQKDKLLADHGILNHSSSDDEDNKDEEEDPLGKNLEKNSNGNGKIVKIKENEEGKKVSKAGSESNNQKIPNQLPIREVMRKKTTKKILEGGKINEIVNNEDIKKCYDDILLKLGEIKGNDLKEDLNNEANLLNQKLDMSLFNKLVDQLFTNLKGKSEYFFKEDLENVNGHIKLFDNINSHLIESMKIYKLVGDDFSYVNNLEKENKKDKQTNETPNEKVFKNQSEAFKDKIGKIFDELLTFSPNLDKNKKDKKKKSEKKDEEEKKKIIKFYSMFLFGFIEAYVSLQLTSQLNFKLNNENISLRQTNSSLLQITEILIKKNLELSQLLNKVNTQVIRSNIIGGNCSSFIRGMPTKKGSFIRRTVGASSFVGSFVGMAPGKNNFSLIVSSGQLKAMKNMQMKNMENLQNNLNMQTGEFDNTIKSTQPFDPNTFPNISQGRHQSDKIGATGIDIPQLDLNTLDDKNKNKFGKLNTVEEYQKEEKKKEKADLFKEDKPKVILKDLFTQNLNSKRESKREKDKDNDSCSSSSSFKLSHSSDTLKTPMNKLNQKNQLNNQTNQQNKQGPIIISSLNQNNAPNVDLDNLNQASIDSIMEKSKELDSKFLMIKQFIIKSLENNDTFKNELEYSNLYYRKIIAALERVILDKLGDNQIISEKETDLLCGDTYEYLNGPQNPNNYTNLFSRNTINNNYEEEDNLNNNFFSPEHKQNLGFLRSKNPVRALNNEFNSYQKQESLPLTQPNMKNFFNSNKDGLNYSFKDGENNLNNFRESNPQRYYYPTEANEEVERLNGNNFINPNLSAYYNNDLNHSQLTPPHPFKSMTLDHFGLDLTGKRINKNLNKDIEDYLEDFMKSGSASRKFDGISVKVQGNQVKYLYECGLNCSNVIKYAPTMNKVLALKGDSDEPLSGSTSKEKDREIKEEKEEREEKEEKEIKEEKKEKKKKKKHKKEKKEE